MNRSAGSVLGFFVSADMSDTPANDSEQIAQLDASPYKVRRCRYGLMSFIASDDTIGRALELYGEFAQSENDLMVRLIKPGDTAVDVGANVGTVTLALARAVGREGRVFSFEPQRLVFQNLCASLSLNGLTNVYPMQSAVGDREGSVKSPELDPTRAVNFGAARLDENNAGMEVPLTTIDRLDLADCTLIKIDVEGMDYEVLLGASATIQRTRPHIYMEAKSGENTANAIRWLQDRDYDLYWHFATFFSATNYRGNTENVFGGRGDINMLAVPTESGLRARLPHIEGPNADWQSDYRKFRLSDRNLMDP